MKKENLKVLIVDDDIVVREILSDLLSKTQYYSHSVSSGEKAWELLNKKNKFSIVLLDWMMPGFSGIDLLKKIRKSKISKSLYIILVTAKSDTNSSIKALNLGADDYIKKPFNEEELIARIKAGERVVKQQKDLAFEIKDLACELKQIKNLSGILPICSFCYKVRDKNGKWKNLEIYLEENYKVRSSHSVCPECCDEHYSGY
ncbi:MAG: response regulator transcription factor [Acidobacteriota bacterium]